MASSGVLRESCVFRGTTFDQFQEKIVNGSDGRIFYLCPGKVDDLPGDAILSSLRHAEQSSKPPCVICIPAEYSFQSSDVVHDAAYISSPSFRVFSTFTSLEILLSFAADRMTGSALERLKHLCPTDADPVRAYLDVIRQDVRLYLEKIEQQRTLQKIGE